MPKVVGRKPISIGKGSDSVYARLDHPRYSLKASFAAGEEQHHLIPPRSSPRGLHHHGFIFRRPYMM